MMISIMYEAFNNYYPYKILIASHIILGAYNSRGQLLFKMGPGITKTILLRYNF